MRVRAFLARCRDFFRRREVVAAFDAEAAQHLDDLAREFEGRGLSAHEARFAAQREFGNLTRAREAIHEQSGFPRLEDVGRDLTTAVRSLVRRPVLALGAASTLALALAAATTLVALVDAIFWRPLPVAHPEQLYILRESGDEPLLASAGTARRLADLLPAGSAVAAHSGEQEVTVRRADQPAERADGQLVAGGFFSALGIAPVAGRMLSEADDKVGAPADVVVANEGWAQERFGSAEAALDAELVVNQHPVRIVGVVPRRFVGVAVGASTDLWFPAALQAALRVHGNSRSASTDEHPIDPDWNRDERVAWMRLLVRLPHGTDRAILSQLNAAWLPERDALMTVFDDPQQRDALLRPVWQIDPASRGYSYFRSSFGPTSRLLAGIVIALLLLASANVSNLLLVRTLARHREIGVRLALGANRWRVTRLAFAEALVVGLVGAGLGLILAQWCLPLAARLLAPGEQLALGVFEWRPLAVLGVVTGIAVALCVGAPALWISRLDPLVALTGRAGLQQTPVRLGRVLVGAQLALAILVVTVAVTLGRELQRVLARDPGFAQASVLTSRFSPASAGYNDEAAKGLVQRLEASARAVPGVVDVGFACAGILAGSRSRSGIYPRGDDVRVRNDQCQGDGVSPGYFAAVGMTLLRGRTFTTADNADAPHVAVVNESFGRTYFGTPDVLGRRFGFGPQIDTGDWTIVGIVADAIINAVKEKPPAMFFTPDTQSVGATGFIAVRAGGDPAIVSGTLRDALARAELALVWGRWQTLRERVRGDVQRDASISWMVGALGLVAMLLASLGIGVTLAHLVTLRRREIAVRMALGADQRLIVRDVLRDAWRIAGIGGVAGIAVIWLIPQFPLFASLLPTRPDFGAALVALTFGLLAATLGGWRPARHAARVDPQELLKAE